MRRLATSVALVTLSLCLPNRQSEAAPVIAPAVTAPAVTALAAHQAEYTLKLGSARNGDVTSGTGTMDYKVIDACDGWAVSQRLTMLLTNRDGQDINMVSDYTTYEPATSRKRPWR